MKRLNTKYVGCLIGIIIVAILVGLYGYGSKTPPSAPLSASSIYGTFSVPEGTGGSFIVLKWEEGLTIVLVDDIIDGIYEYSGGSSEDPVWGEKGGARAADGRQVSWRIETTDGKTAAFFINEQNYNLVQGTLFLIRTSGGQTRVMQHQLNLTRPCSNSDECYLLLKDDPLIMQFIQKTLNSHQAAQ